MQAQTTAAVRTRRGEGRPVVDTAANILLAFGDSQYDELGNAGWYSPIRQSWTALPDGATIVDVAAGNMHGLAVTDDGRLLAWGSNEFGQLGDGSTDPQDLPEWITIPGASEVAAVAAGNAFSLALTVDGEVYAWGSDSSWQLGTGSNRIDSHTPVLVTIPWADLGLPLDTKVTAIAAGDGGSLALTSTGDVLAWGGTVLPGMAVPFPALVPLPARAVGIAAGWSHVLVATEDGKVYAWGANAQGQCGQPNSHWVDQPTEVPLPDGVQVVEVAAGRFAYFSVALTSDGRVLTWGGNNYGQLGCGKDGSELQISYTPVWVVLPEGVRVTAIAAGANHGLAASSTGRILGWGSNTSGQMGVNIFPFVGFQQVNPTPVWISQPAGTVPVAMSGGFMFSLVAVASGPALGWGDNSSGQLGNPDVTTSGTPILVEVPADLASVMDSFTLVHAATGYTHSLGVTTSGDVYAWGDNAYGQLGNPAAGTGSKVPVKVQGLPDDALIVQVAAGQWHSLALAGDGRVFGWGRNNRGQLGLGDGGPAQVDTPRQVTGLPGVFAISSTNLHCLAVAVTPAVYAWGDNSYGQLGDGSSGNIRTSPLKVHYGSCQVAAGGTFSLALGSTGKMYGWGYNYYGQLGTGDSGVNASKLTPTEVILPEAFAGVKFKDLAAGLSHSLALSIDGQVFTTGNNVTGQLGNGTTEPTGVKFNPIDTSGLPDDIVFGAIGAGHQHSLAAAIDGQAYAWGSNAQGQLGSGQAFTARDNAPQPVKQDPDTPITLIAGGGKFHSLAI